MTLGAKRLLRAVIFYESSRPPAINDCLQMLEFCRHRAGMLDEALDDGGCTEDRRDPMDFEQLENLRRIEFAAFGDDLRGGLRDMRENVETSAVRHGRRMENAIIR